MQVVSAYSITTARTDLTVDPESRATEFTVDVKNEQARFDRVMLDFESLGTGTDTANPSWFTVDNQPHSIPGEGSEQILVKVEVPVSVGQGSYRMRPTAYSSDRPPDETRVDGPPMTVTVPPSGGNIPPRRGRWLWWLTAIVAFVFAAIATVWGLLAGSEVILLHAVFTPLCLFITLSSLIVSRIAAKDPTTNEPDGRNAFAPIVVIAQAIILAGAIAYAILEAVRVIFSTKESLNLGHSAPQVSGLSLFAYGVFSAVFSLIAWLVFVRIVRRRVLVEPEAAASFSAGPGIAVIVTGSALIAIGTVIVELRGYWGRYYLDPILVIIICLGFAVILANLVRRSVGSLRIARPDSQLVAQVETVVEKVRTAEGLPEPILRVGHRGPVVDTAIAFVLPPGTGDIACADRVRRALHDGLDDLPYSMSITVEFGHDAELLAK